MQRCLGYVLLVLVSRISLLQRHQNSLGVAEVDENMQTAGLALKTFLNIARWLVCCVTAGLVSCSHFSPGAHTPIIYCEGTHRFMQSKAVNVSSCMLQSVGHQFVGLVFVCGVKGCRQGNHRSWAPAHSWCHN